jgi:hypothetical protein
VFSFACAGRRTIAAPAQPRRLVCEGHAAAAKGRDQETKKSVH